MKKPRLEVGTAGSSRRTALRPKMSLDELGARYGREKVVKVYDEQAIPHDRKMTTHEFVEFYNAVTPWRIGWRPIEP